MMRLLRSVVLLLTALVAYLNAVGQVLTKRLIVTDTKDSLFYKSDSKAFNRSGEYCFEIRQGDKVFYRTPTGDIGNTSFIGSEFSTGGNISYTHQYSDAGDKPWYYRNIESVKVYGPIKGKIENYQTSHTKANIAIQVSYKDSVCRYVNGKLVSKLSSKEVDKSYLSVSDWCAFSKNGNAIYYVQRNGKYNLYVNTKQIASSIFSYTQLAINDDGDYVFAEGRRPAQKMSKYDYMFFIHSKDTTLSYVRTVWNYELKNNGAYYYSGDDNGPSYIAINNRMYKGLKNIGDIININKKTFLYTFEENGKNKVNVNGKSYQYDFKDIFFPALDQAENFAFFGLKNYYLYKFVNGVRVEKPISRYGVRPTPLYISPRGESLHYFTTDDSIYLYRDDKLIFKPISKAKKFKILPAKEFMPKYFILGESKSIHSLFYLEYDAAAYLVFDGVLSQPMTPIVADSYQEKHKTGEIALGEVSDIGFFVVQKLAEATYLININNKVYQKVNTDAIVSDSFYFDGKELTFYGAQETGIYQFKLKL